MEINLIRLRTVLDDRENTIVKENNAFLDEINNELFEDDLTLVENLKTPKFSVFFIETGGTENKFLNLFPSIDDTVILLSNGKNNSLAACFEIKTYCNTHKVPALIITGSEKYCATLIAKFARVAFAKKKFEGSRLGIIGKPSDWLIASQVSVEDAKKIFNIDLIDIDMEVLFEEVDKRTYGCVPHLENIKAKYKDSEVLEESLHIYGALKRIIDTYQLNGLTIRCFDLLGKYKNTACLALALLNEEGITCACEGDVPTLLTMHLIRCLTDNGAFQANPSKMDQENKTMLFSHCTLPLNMVSKYELMTHFESNLGVAIKGELALGEISICKLFINEEHNLENSVAIRATIKENNSLPGYCRTQITAQFDEYGFVNFLKEDFGNHVVIAYNDICDDFYALLAVYNLKTK